MTFSLKGMRKRKLVVRAEVIQAEMGEIGGTHRRGGNSIDVF